MTRAEIARDLERVSRALVLSVGALERLVLSLGEPQDGQAREEAPTIGRSAVPACSCPCCLEERARGERP